MPPDNREITAPLHIVWAGRWEHDKNPAQLLAILRGLADQRTPFQLSVLGQTFSQIPAAFAQIRKNFSSQIVNWGFQESRKAYWRALQEGDVILSTANHEFFGLAVVEAMSVGLVPVLPRRLAYPELLQLISPPLGGLFGDEEEAIARLSKLAADREALRRSEVQTQIARRTKAKFGWHHRAKELDQHLTRVATERCDPDTPPSIH